MQIMVVYLYCVCDLRPFSKVSEDANKTIKSENIVGYEHKMRVTENTEYMRRMGYQKTSRVFSRMSFKWRFTQRRFQEYILL